MLNRLTTAARVSRLVMATLHEHLSDDPVQLAVLVGQRLPSRARGAVAHGVMSVAPPRTIAYSLGQWFSGRRTEVLSALHSAAEAGAPQPRLERLASLAVATGQARDAERLADLVASQRGALLSARARWLQGRLGEALQRLPVGPTDKHAQRVRERLVGEFEVLSGRWAPRLPLPPRPLEPVDGRVLHIVTNSVPYTRSGYSLRTQHIVRAQRAAGLDPHVVTRPGYPVTVGLPTSLDGQVVDGVPHHRLLPAKLGPAPDARLTQQVELTAHLVERLRPSVLHATSHYINGLVALALGERYRLPVVYEVRGFLEETWVSRLGPDAENTDRYRLSRERETECMQRADLVVTLGEVMRDEIAARGIDPEKILVAPNAVDDGFLAPPPDPAGLRAHLGVRPDEIVLGTVTSVVPYEGLDTLVNAVRLLKNRGKAVRLLVVGDGVELPALQRQAAELGLAGIATFTGRVPHDHVRDYHAAIDVFVLPRRDDRVCRLVTPLKPIEAMATGRPVVASDLPALREIVQHQKTGALFPADDASALAAAVEPLLSDGALRSSLGSAARAWVAEGRTWASNAQRYRAAYAALGAARREGNRS